MNHVASIAMMQTAIAYLVEEDKEIVEMIVEPETARSVKKHDSSHSRERERRGDRVEAP